MSITVTLSLRTLHPFVLPPPLYPRRGLDGVSLHTPAILGPFTTLLQPSLQAHSAAAEAHRPLLHSAHKRRPTYGNNNNNPASNAHAHANASSGTGPSSSNHAHHHHLRAAAHSGYAQNGSSSANARARGAGMGTGMGGEATAVHGLGRGVDGEGLLGGRPGSAGSGGHGSGPGAGGQGQVPLPPVDPAGQQHQQQGAVGAWVEGEGGGVGGEGGGGEGGDGAVWGVELSSQLSASLCVGAAICLADIIRQVGGTAGCRTLNVHVLYGTGQEV